MVEPEALLKVPAGHAAQFLSAGEAPRVEKVPAGQRLQRYDPGVSAKVPGAQSSHDKLPLNDEYVPTAQSVQASSRAIPPDFIPILPLGQYFAHVDCPINPLKEPSSQGSQVELEKAPVTGEAVPAGHSVQSVAPEKE